jgi:hypothetical protein
MSDLRDDYADMISYLIGLGLHVTVYYNSGNQQAVVRYNSEYRIRFWVDQCGSGWWIYRVGNFRDLPKASRARVTNLLESAARHRDYLNLHQLGVLLSGIQDLLPARRLI